MAESPGKSTEDAGRVKTLWFENIDHPSLSTELADCEAQLAADLAPVCSAFRTSIKSVVSLATLPHFIVMTSVLSEQYLRIITAERIRGLKITSRAPKTEAGKARKATRTANRIFDRQLADGGMERVRQETTRRLSVLVDTQAHQVAAHTLTRQIAVLTWSAFEVLARDALIAHLNTAPSKALMLSQSAPVARKFDLDTIDLELIATHNFNLSRSMGTILEAKFRLDDLASIKTTYKALAPNNAALHDALNSKELWLLAQKRNLIVHRGGIVDRKYLSQTGDTLALGSELVFEPDDAVMALRHVAHTGKLVLLELGRRIESV